jgi:gluconate 2-dehydrogenase gamma chain
MKRRRFLTVSVTALGGTLVYRLDRSFSVVHAQSSEPQSAGKIRVPLRFFDERQALIVAAAAARIFPTDESGPGAGEAGVVIYIDRQLASPYGRDRHRFTQEPFEDGVPEQGYQGKATPREVYRDGIASLGPDFARLSPAAQDARLHQIEDSYFFSLLRQHTIEGMFCDPMHGGNADLIGWQLIGYPGPYMSWAQDIDRHYGEAFRPKPQSLAQVVGHKTTPWEQEP